MGRHSGPVTSESTHVELESAGHIGPRRAALMAERQNPANQNIDIEALTSRAQREADERSEAAEVAVLPKGSAFVAAPLSPELEANSEGLIATYDVKRIGGKKNAGFGAAAMIAAVSLFGATGAVSANSLLSKNEAQADTGDSQVMDTASIAKASQPVTFTVKVDGESQTVTSSAANLHDALVEAGIHVNSDDKVSAHMADPVADGETVTIVRVVTTSVTEKTTDKFTTEKIEDSSLAEGEENVETKGVDGVSIKTFDVTTEDGKETSKVETMSVVQSAPVNEVVRVGTGAADSDDDSASDSSSESTSTAAVVPSGTAQSIAHSMMASYGWGEDQFTCLVSLWNRESGWDYTAMNASSGAYGIPQALPGSKMASAGSDWQTNPATQITWGLGYISGRYGNPCGAWSHSESVGWY